MAVGELQTPGQRSKWLRVSQDKTQEAIAREVFVSQATISQIERDIFIPRMALRRRLADAYGVHHDFIWRPEDLAARKRVA